MVYSSTWRVFKENLSIELLQLSFYKKTFSLHPGFFYRLLDRRGSKQASKPRSATSTLIVLKF
jgi:hypothetical protein